MPLLNVDLTPNASVSSSINWTRSGNTYTTTGQFCSILFTITQTTGKVYLEFTVTNPAADGGAGCYYGIQRPPTRTGNYHNGTGVNGNGGLDASYSVASAGTYSVLVDIDAQTVSWNNQIPVAIPGTGQLYFAIYDGTSGGNGSVTINWGGTAFTNSIPAGATAIGEVYQLPSANDPEVQCLVVGGGGGTVTYSGGNAVPSGGAGAGAVVVHQALILTPNTEYTITVGQGGQVKTVSGTPHIGNPGEDSSFSTIIVAKGGGGGGFYGVGGNGGSSGGGGYNVAAAGTVSIGTTGGGIGYANVGGVGAGISGGGAGGGGAGAAGAASSGTSGQPGGIGILNDFSGVNTYYGGGGGGGSSYSSGGSGAPGGLGGGGTGATASPASPATSGADNTGGGAGANVNSLAGASGGSGIVIVRYLGSARGTGGTIAAANGYTSHIFTSSGTFVLTSNYVGFEVNGNATSSANEGQTVTIIINGSTETGTRNYTITGVTSDDIGGANLSGTVNLVDYRASFNLTISEDYSVNEGNETLTVSFTDEGNTVEGSLTVFDTSVLLYVTPTVESGGIITVRLNTGNNPQSNGTLIPYTISGDYINEQSIGQSLTGNFVINNNLAEFTINLAMIDSTTLTVTSFGTSADCVITFNGDIDVEVIDMDTYVDLEVATRAFSMLPLSAISIADSSASDDPEPGFISVNAINFADVAVTVTVADTTETGGIDNFIVLPFDMFIPKSLSTAADPEPGLVSISSVDFQRFAVTVTVTETTETGGLLDVYVVRPLGQELIREYWI